MNLAVGNDIDIENDIREHLLVSSKILSNFVQVSRATNHEWCSNVKIIIYYEVAPPESSQ